MKPRAEQSQRWASSPMINRYDLASFTISQLEDREAELRKAGLKAAAHAIRREIQARMFDASG